MLTPLTIDIYQGAFASFLEQGMPGTTAQIGKALPEWKQPSTGLPAPDPDPAALDVAATRYHLTYVDLPDTPLHRFYDTRLQSEAFRLKERLNRQVALCPSEVDARLLLCRVLEELYDTGVRMDEAVRRHVQPQLCGLLKGVLASLYLELTVDFGHLLDEGDYSDYRCLLADVRYRHPVDEDEALRYDIMQKGNRVKRLSREPDTARCEEQASRLYAELLPLLARLNRTQEQEPALWQGVVALENLLFLLRGPYRPADALHYELWVDEQWMQGCLSHLRDNHYDGHLGYSEARGAAQWVMRKLDEPCLAFLSPRVPGKASLPRRLRSYLLDLQALYEQNYAASFVPVCPDGKLVMVGVDGRIPSRPDAAEVHALLEFLRVKRDKTGVRLMTDEHVQWLEEDFLAFLQGAALPVEHLNRVKIRSGYAEKVYGLFYHYVKVKKGDKRGCWVFLSSILDVDTTAEDMYKNSARYLKAYLAFAKEENLPLIS